MEFRVKPMEIVVSSYVIFISYISLGHSFVQQHQIFVAYIRLMGNRGIFHTFASDCFTFLYMILFICRNACLGIYIYEYSTTKPKERAFCNPYGLLRQMLIEVY